VAGGVGHGLLFLGISLERRAVFSRLLAECILCDLFRGFHAGHLPVRPAIVFPEYRSGVFLVLRADWGERGFERLVLSSAFGRDQSLFLAGGHVQDEHLDLLLQRGPACLYVEYVCERGARVFSWIVCGVTIIKPQHVLSQISILRLGAS
jgi:hypothetical protein